MFQAATAAGYKALTLPDRQRQCRGIVVAMGTLRDPRLGTALAHACQIERRLSEILDTQAVSATCPGSG